MHVDVGLCARAWEVAVEEVVCVSLMKVKGWGRRGVLSEVEQVRGPMMIDRLVVGTVLGGMMDELGSVPVPLIMWEVDMREAQGGEEGHLVIVCLDR